MSDHLQNSFKNLNKNLEKNIWKSDAFLEKQFAKITGPVTFLLYDLRCYFLFKMIGYRTNFTLKSLIDLLNQPVWKQLARSLVRLRYWVERSGLFSETSRCRIMCQTKKEQRNK